MTTLLPSDTTTIASTLCYGDSVLFGGNYISNTGTYTHLLQNAVGCDSLIILNVTLDSEIITTLTEEICEGDTYVVGSSVYDTTGQFIDTLTAVNGCDSIVILNLELKEVAVTNIQQTICEGEEFEFLNGMLNTSGVYVDTMTAMNGCDSIVILDLTVIAEPIMQVSDTICNSGQYIVGTSVYTMPGSYTDTLVGANGCDSIVILDLAVVPYYEFTNEATICEGGGIWVNGTYRSNSGTYRDTLKTLFGCDSIVVTKIEVVDEIKTKEELTICQGDSAMIGGFYQSIEGTYTHTYTAATGCDSVVTTKLIVEPLPTLEAEDAYICEGESVKLEVEGGENHQWSPATGLSCTNCPSPVASPNFTTVYTVSAITCGGIVLEKTVTVYVDPIPELTASDNQFIYLGDSVTLTASTTSSNARIEWSDENGVLCNDCTTLTVTPMQTTQYRVAAITPNGCREELVVTVYVSSSCPTANIEVPNIITPNGDGANDLFEVRFSGLADIRLVRVYNRWGQLIFETYDVNQKWDGTFRGEMLDPGVFVYYIEATCLNGDSTIKRGNVTLIR